MAKVGRVRGFVVNSGENAIEKAQASSDPQWVGRVAPTSWSLSSDRQYFEYAFEGGVLGGPRDSSGNPTRSTLRSVLFAHLDVTEVPDGELIADLVRADLQKDNSVLYPPRPGQVHQSSFLLGPKALEDRAQLSSEKDLFYEPDEDRMALLAVYRDRTAAEFVSGIPLEPVYKTNRFLLQQAQEVQSERVQIMETFGDPQLFLYGKQAEIYQYSGILLNTRTFQWKTEFLQAWDTFLRGTVSRENKTRVYLTYDNVLREGFLLNSSISQSTELRQVVFNFSMFIVRKRLFSTVPMSSIEQRNLADANREAEASFSEQEGGNKLGFPIVYETSITDRERDGILERVNLAVGQQIEPPYTFVLPTWPDDSG